MVVAHETSVPVIDLSPLRCSDAAEEARRKVVSLIGEASEEWGFFQVINHGLSSELLDQVFNVSKSFFDMPTQEKLKARADASSSPVATGFVNDDYTRGVLDPKEHFLLFHEGSTSQEVVHRYSRYNIWPQKPQEFRPTVEKFLEEVEKTSIFVMGLVSESLGLPASKVHDYYKEKTNALSIFCYPPSDRDDAFGTSSHKDGNVLTLLAQSDASGLQVLKDDNWVTVEPIKGALIVNIGDMLQIWSNAKYKSVTHRVMNNKTHTRYSIGYFCTPGAQTYMLPMPEFTTHIGQPPKYNGFFYKEYLMHRFQNKKNMDKNTPDVGIYIYETQEAVY